MRLGGHSVEFAVFVWHTAPQRVTLGQASRGRHCGVQWADGVAGGTAWRDA
jgi:hypothetical protein